MSRHYLRAIKVDKTASPRLIYTCWYSTNNVLKEVLRPYFALVSPIAGPRVAIQSNAIEAVASPHPREIVRPFIGVEPFAMQLTIHVGHCFEC